MISDQWQTQHKAAAAGYLQLYFEGIHSAHFLLAVSSAEEEKMKAPL